MKFHMQRLPRNFGWPISVFFCCPFAVNNFDVFFFNSVFVRFACNFTSVAIEYVLIYDIPTNNHDEKLYFDIFYTQESIS